MGSNCCFPAIPHPAWIPRCDGDADAASRFVAGLGDARLAVAGLRVEDKGPIQALHWRGAASEEAAEALAREIAAEAASDGIDPHWGRKVLELRPAGAVGKDVAVSVLLASTEVSTAVYGGDDRTDLDAFRRLRDCAGAASWSSRSASASPRRKARPSWRTKRT